MKELGRVYAKTDVILGIEPTGHYWFTLAEFLQQQGIKLDIVNPHHVCKSKELEDNSPTKMIIKMPRLLRISFASIGLTEGLTAAKIELKDLLEQYRLFVQQNEDTMKQVEELLEQVPGTCPTRTRR